MGRLETTEAAIADGRYEREHNDANGYVSVRIADEGPAVRLAVEAATLALKRSDVEHSDYDLVVHSSLGYQGLDHFAPASYVQGNTIGGTATAIEVKQASLGGMAALELAAAYVSVRPAPSAALVCTSDRFVAPMYDRYRTDGGLLFSDAGTAVVLSRGHGVAKLLSTSLIGDTEHLGLYDGNAPWADAAGLNGWPVDLKSRAAGYIEEIGGMERFIDIVQSLDARQQQTVREAADDAGVAVADIDWWVFANVGQTMVDWDTYRAMGIDPSRAIWDDWGRHTGHIGAGDQLGGLVFLLESGRLKAGDRIMLNGAGQGFTFASAVLEITDPPEWSSSAI